MQKKWIALAALAVVPPVAIFMSDDGYQEIEWSDFEGKPPADPGERKAMISMDYEVDVTTSAEPDGEGGYKGTASGGVTPSMDKGNSWVLPGFETPELLEHEQYHLDIHYFWANAINACVENVCVSDPDGATAASKAGEAAQACVDGGAALCALIQGIYDIHTGHGSNAPRQAWWCELVADWITPDEQDAEVTETEAVGDVEVEGGGNQRAAGSATPMLQIPDVQVGSYSTPSGTVQDPVLGQLTWSFPALAFEGYFMGARTRLFSLEGDRTVTLRRGTGDPVLQGELLHMMGDESGTVYRAWISPVQIDSRAASLSPFLSSIKAQLQQRRLLSVELHLPTSIESVTANWTQSAPVQMLVRLGTVELADACDVNFDGVVDTHDITPFRELLVGRYPKYFPWAGDANGDGQTDAADIEPFLACVGG